MTPAARHRSARRRRGSVLVVALLLTAMFILVLGSYLNLTLGSADISRRSFDRATAFQLAEAGVEEAVWAYNQALAGRPTWTEWKSDGTAAWRKFTDFTLTPGSSGVVKVYATSTSTAAASSTPQVLAQASVQTGARSAVTETIEITLRRRGYFANGLVALRKLEFRGRNSSFDSWDSDPDRDPATPPVDYSTSVRSDLGNVATGATGSATDGTSLYVRSARLNGYLTTAGARPQVFDGLLGSFAASPGEVDASRLATDFNANFPAIPAPEDGTWIKTFGATLGTAGQTTRWRAANLSLSGKQTLTILGNVTLILTAAPDTTAISITSGLIIPAGSSLTIYLAGDVSISGQGLVNNNIQPAQLVLWGVNTTERGQAIRLSGSAALRAVIYAPKGDIALTGNGDLYGSIIARDIIFSGNAAFHYDRSLETLATHGQFGVQSWRDLSPAEQTGHNALFSGW